jgi:hypothetical protein
MKRVCLHQTRKLMDIFLCELERSGNPRSELSLRNPRREFHPVGSLVKRTAVYMRFVINNL